MSAIRPQSGISVNVAVPYVGDWGLFLKRMIELNPSIILAHLDNMNDKSRIDELAATLPDTHVIGRAVVKDIEGAFHERREKIGPNGEKFKVEPSDALNVWGSLGVGRNRSVNLMNEPMLNGITLPVLNDLVEWFRIAGNLARMTNRHLTVGNFFTGQPEVADGPNGSEWDPRYDGILKVASEYRDVMDIGLHEYYPDADGNRVGRIHSAVRRCDTLLLSGAITRMPRFSLTEYGADANAQLDPPDINNYRSRGWDGTLYAEYLILWYLKQYQSLVDTGLLRGAATFVYGSPVNGQFRNWDTERDAEFWKHLLANAHRVWLPQTLKPYNPPVIDVVKEPTTEPPKPVELPQTPPKHWLDVLTEPERHTLLTLSPEERTLLVGAIKLINRITEGKT